jgi:DNA invertase Pin-like site-specific DNA recombinase/transposase-like protein
LRQYCMNKHMTVVRVYKDEGYSGTNLSRPAIQRLLEQASLGSFKKIVCWRYDRLSRNKIEFPQLHEFFQKLGIDVISICEPNLSYSDPDGEFVIDIFGLLSSRERKVMVQRMKMGKRIRAEKGLYRGGPPPLGYDYDKVQGKLKINKDKKIIQMIFKKYIDTKSINSVRNYLNDTGVKSKMKFPWYLNTVGRILSMKVYTGYYVYRDIEKFDKEIQIITEKNFIRVQKIKDENRKKLPEFFNGSVVDITFKSDEEILSDMRLSKYVRSKHEMPHCTRCGNQYPVRKDGWSESQHGKLQMFYCTDCNYEFRIYPNPIRDARLDAIRPTCPVCRSKKIVSEGTDYNRKGKLFRVWECKDCRKVFRTYAQQT